jgi:hypothetical protein
MKFVFHVLLVCSCIAGASLAADLSPKWSGAGQCRILVKVEPVDIGARSADEMVAQYEVDFAKLLTDRKVQGHVDLSSLQVQKYELGTGEPEKFKPFTTSRSEFDRPCRFEDISLPEDYPDRVTRASETANGRAGVLKRKRGARLFNREMDNTRGKLSWVHTQIGNAPSLYAIYFDVKKSLAECGPAPAPWIGDADVYRMKDGQDLGGLSHLIVGLGDFDGDGLFDLVGGAEKGDLMWFPNHGTKGDPKFVGCRMLTDEDGPIDCGWYGAPLFVDWDNDGLVDLLAGTNHNVILWWKNIGTKTSPKLSYHGFVQCDGKQLQVPEQPVPEDPSGIFKHDYYNQPWVGDWDGDGIPDILTGGYVTGEIFFFKGAGRNADGTPALQYAGPLKADDGVLDTVWAAAPCAADVDGDGDLDLITGSWFWSGIHRPEKPGETEYLMFYRNIGTKTEPKLHREPLPHVGEFPKGTIARPNAVDWNNDGLIDLLVSDHSGTVRVFLNKGTATSPRFDCKAQQLTGQWGFVREGGYSSRAVLAKDGVPDLLGGQQFSRAEGSPYSPRFVPRGRATVNGKPIEHPGPGYGDAYYSTVLFDWNHDGRADLFWGTQQGNVYLHQNLGGDDPYAFAPGEKMMLTTGEELRVGPEVVKSAAEAKDFTVLQGSRIVMDAADVDGDGISDLIVTETFGNLWVFRGTKNGSNVVEPGVKVGSIVGRRTGELSIIDWNEDGKPDIIIGQPADNPGSVYINQSTAGKPQFAEPTQPLHLPFMFWGPSIEAVDWNGDGDEDLLVFAEFYSFYVEKSFIKFGYRPAALVGALEQTTKPSTQPAALWLEPRVRQLKLMQTGPFVQLADGALLCVKDDTALTSHDNGETWTSRPIFGDRKLKARPEQALIRTSKGVIVAVLLDDLDKRWKWNAAKHATDGEARLHVWAIRSTDEGKTWSDLQMIQDGYSGAVRDIIELDNGDLVAATQKYLPDQARHAAVPFVSHDQGKTWQATGVLDGGGRGNHAGTIEPTLVQLRDNRLWMLLRTNLDCLYQSFSEDRGMTWGKLSPTTIDASSSPAICKRLADGKLVLVWNRLKVEGRDSVERRGGESSETAASWQRSELSIAFSSDDGKTWTTPTVIARQTGGRLAYPYLLERRPGLLWITTMQGGLRVELNESEF